MEFTAKRAIGLMSGTSGDGVDAALIVSDGEKIIETGAVHFVEYSHEERRFILSIMQQVRLAPSHERRSQLAVEVDDLIVSKHRQAVVELIDLSGFGKDQIDVVGFHGQTLFHDPSQGFTLQAGNGQKLARLLGLPVVYDFRRNDMRHGGQGAPLVPAYHRALVLASDLPLPVAIVNIGGIANITFIGKDGDLLAFDCGPGNVLMDEWVGAKTGARMDVGGALAAKGRVDHELVAHFLNRDYFIASPPKSLDRYDLQYDFGNDLTLEDGLATFLEITVQSIVRSQRFFGEQVCNWVVVGGGAHNQFLMNRLARELAGSLLPADDLGWLPGFIEAQAFGFLAVRHLFGLPLTFPLTTGVARPLIGGKLA